MNLVAQTEVVGDLARLELNKKIKGEVKMNIKKLKNMLELVLLGDDNQDGDTLETVIEALAEQFKPLLYTLAREGFEVYKDVVNNDDYFEQRAQMKWKLFAAYLDAGFREEQAMMLILEADSMRRSVEQVVSSSLKRS